MSNHNSELNFISTKENRPALWRRFASMFYDAWLILALWIAGTALIVGLKTIIDPSPLAEGERAISGSWRAPTFFLQLLTFYVFYAYFWVKTGQTLAMQAWRLKVVNEQGNAISYQQAFIRLSLAILSLAALGFGYFYSFFDKEKRCFHDKMSGTYVVLTEKHDKKQLKH